MGFNSGFKGLNQYRQSLYNKLEIAEECQNINTEWQQIKDSVLNAAIEVIQDENKEPRKEWWDDECREALEEKNLARMKCTNRRRRMNQNHYMEKRKTANAICKRKKKKWINDKIKQIEEANRKNKTRKFYKNSAFFNKKQTQLIPLCKDNNGAIISEKILVLEKWKQYFNKILNSETQQAKNNYEVPLQGNDGEEIETPTYKEINNIISKLKGNKAPGPDNITAELIKSVGYILKLRIYNLILKIWKNEQIPEEWTEGIICPIFKKRRSKTV